MTQSTHPPANASRIDPREVPVESIGYDLPVIDASRLTPTAIRQRLLNPPAWQPELTGDRQRIHTTEPRPAAVLIPIITHSGGLTVLLTERTAHLNSHAGQVAFPGGRRDPEDRDLVATALREAREEIGLSPQRVDVISTLPDYLTGTGYRVTPVVGLIEPGFDLNPHDFEVAQVFEVPLSFLMDPRHHRRHRFLDANNDRLFYSMPWHCERRQREFFIWGATAAMLRNLYRLLSA